MGESVNFVGVGDHLPLPNGAVARLIEDSRHLLVIREPLQSKAPCPDKTLPYCCYARTVIFYVGPRHIVRPWHFIWRSEYPTSALTRQPVAKWNAEKPGMHYEEWGRVEHQLGWDTKFVMYGSEYECGGGRVKWIGKQWVMDFWARRKWPA